MGLSIISTKHLVEVLQSELHQHLTLKTNVTMAEEHLNWARGELRDSEHVICQLRSDLGVLHPDPGDHTHSGPAGHNELAEAPGGDDD